jgi:type IV pilus assembly protein PilW
MSPSDRRAATGRQQRGLSLIELMIAVALGLLLVTVVMQGFASTSSNSRVSSVVSEYQTNGRYALETLKREIRHAALHPMVWDEEQVDRNASVDAKNYGCGAGVSTTLGTGITGWNDTNPYAATCLAAGADRTYLRGDALMLRRTALAAATVFDANAPYARVSYGAANVYLGGEVAAELAIPSFDYRLVSDLYYVNDFTTSTTESPKVPALYRLTLSAGANPTMVPQLVASNVEHFQVQFGQVMDVVTGSIRYFNADAVIDWKRVNVARVWLLMRATEREIGFTSGSYQLGDVTYTPNDSFRRVVLSTTINLRNL